MGPCYLAAGAPLSVQLTKVMKSARTDRQPQLQGRVRDIRPSLVPFFLFLVLGFLCLFAAQALRPNPDLKWSYEDDPAYAVEMRLAQSVQTLSDTIAARIAQLNHRKLPK